MTFVEIATELTPRERGRLSAALDFILEMLPELEAEATEMNQASSSSGSPDGSGVNKASKSSRRKRRALAPCSVYDLK